MLLGTHFGSKDDTKTWQENWEKENSKCSYNNSVTDQIMLNGILHCIVVTRLLVWCVKWTFRITFCSSYSVEIHRLIPKRRAKKKTFALPPRTDRKPATFFPTWILQFSREWILPCNPIYYPRYRKKCKSCYSMESFLSTDTKHFHSLYLSIFI